MESCLERLKEEEEFARGLMVGKGVELCLSHNDFYYLNFLQRSNESIQLIDFEYSAMNPKGWDLINLIAENSFIYQEQYPYFTLDKDCIPSEEKLLELFKYYAAFLQNQDQPMPHKAEELIAFLNKGAFLEKEQVLLEAKKLTESFWEQYALVNY